MKVRGTKVRPLCSGSRFKIDLDADKHKEQKNVSERSIKDLNILLVEDNELNMEIAEFLLQNEGAQVTKAWNGQELLSYSEKVDLVNLMSFLWTL